MYDLSSHLPDDWELFGLTKQQIEQRFKTVKVRSPLRLSVSGDCTSINCTDGLGGRWFQLTFDSHGRVSKVEGGGYSCMPGESPRWSFQERRAAVESCVDNATRLLNYMQNLPEQNINSHSFEVMCETLTRRGRAYEELGKSSLAERDFSEAAKYKSKMSD